MKQRKLKGYVLPTLYVIILMFIFGTVSLISTLLETKPNYLYSIGVIKGSESLPVINTNGVQESSISRPYTSDSVTIDKYFYDIQGEEEKQQNALIIFENTYMKNTGVLYKSEETFDCVAVLNGTVLNIKKDEILGNVVEIEHNTNLRTIYYGLSEVNVKVGDMLNQGDLIGKSGTNKISNNKNSLLFEVYYNGTLINPESFYEMDISSLN